MVGVPHPRLVGVLLLAALAWAPQVVFATPLHIKVPEVSERMVRVGSSQDLANSAKTSINEAKKLAGGRGTRLYKNASTVGYLSHAALLMSHAALNRRTPKESIADYSEVARLHYASARILRTIAKDLKEGGHHDDAHWIDAAANAYAKAGDLHATAALGPSPEFSDLALKVSQVVHQLLWEHLALKVERHAQLEEDSDSSAESHARAH